MDINIDPGCNRTMDLDIVLNSLLGPDVTMALVTVQASHTGVALATRWPFDNNMAQGNSPDLMYLQGCQRYQEPWILAQTLAAVGPWPQTTP